MTKTIWSIIVAIIVILIIIWLVSVYSMSGNNDEILDDNGQGMAEDMNNSGENGMMNDEDEEMLMKGEEVAFTGSVSAVYTGTSTDAVGMVSNGLTVETEDGEEVFVATDADTMVMTQDGTMTELANIADGAEVTVRGMVTEINAEMNGAAQSGMQDGNADEGFFDLGIDGFMSLDQATVLASRIQVTETADLNL